MKTNLLFTLCAATMVGCSSNPNGIVSQKAHFNYFNYIGEDDCYKNLHLAANEMVNPILSGFYPDPSVCNRNGDFYLVNSTFAFFPGLPVFHSTDLVNWKQICNAIDRPSQFINKQLGVSAGMYAPTIRYNPNNKKFYIVCTDVYGQGNFLITAENPAGPWSDPILFDFDGIDPSLFFDTDGKAYMVNNADPDHAPDYDSQKAIWMQEFDVNTNKLVGPRKVIRESGHNAAEKPVWLEGPHLYKVGNYYYLMAAEGGTSIDHREVVFRSKNIWGPYETNPNNPILTQRGLPIDRTSPITNAGHADIFQCGTNWFAVFLACRPYNEYNYFNIGRETFMLPVTWNNEWPEILPHDSVIPLKIKKPIQAATLHDSIYIPTGNYTYCEKFTQEKLPLNWLTLRVPTEQWWKTGNGLTINLRSTKITDGKQPSFIGTRQRHHQFTIETTMNFIPENSKEFAGVALFQSETNNYTFGITLKNNKINIELRNTTKNETDGHITPNVMNFAELPETFNGKIILSVVGNKNRLAFKYKINPDDEYITLATNVDAEYLSTDKAGGFIGTIIGLYGEK